MISCLSVLYRHLSGPAPDDNPHQGTHPFVLREGPGGIHGTPDGAPSPGTSAPTSQPGSLDLRGGPPQLPGLQPRPRAAQQRLIAGCQTLCSRHSNPDPKPEPRTKTGVFIRERRDAGQPKQTSQDHSLLEVLLQKLFSSSFTDTSQAK